MKEVHVRFMGSLSDVTGKHNITFELLEEVSTCELFKESLFRKFPELRGKKFAIAVNQEFINKNGSIASGDEVVLLPPFSGG